MGTALGPTPECTDSYPEGVTGRRARGENRAAILQAAFELFSTQGYRETSTAEICRRAGVSSGTLFHYFPTKERLLLALLSSEDDPASPAASLMGLVDRVLTESQDPHVAGFIREVSTLGGLLVSRVINSLTVWDDGICRHLCWRSAKRTVRP